MAYYRSSSSSSLSPALQNLLLKKGISSDDLKRRSGSNVFRTSDENDHPNLDLDLDLDLVLGKPDLAFNEFEAKILRVIRDLPISEGFITLEKQNGVHCRFDAKSTKAKYYECCVEHLSAIFLQSQDLLAATDDDEFLEKYQNSFLWTQNFKLYAEVHALLALNDTSYDLLALLSLCVGLERALGNLFLLKGSQVPTMIKDLLTTSELFEVLGCVPIQILQVVIGPPISMNLRNVAWHGFLSVNELPRRYIYFLLLLTASIGKYLNNRGISIDANVQRGYISLNGIDSIGDHFEVITNEDLHQAEQTICSSWIVNSSNENFFKTAFHLFRSGKYGCSSIMLFPLLEHSLRRLYVQVNDCPSRLITAETTEFFTTFEEILENTLNNGQQNEIVSSLTEPCMDLLHDLLVYPSGPRARDKLSHGEADYTCVNASLPKVLIIILAWLGKETVVKKEFTQKLETCFSSYSSKFHPVALLQQKIIDLAFQCSKLHDQLTLSPSLQPWNPTQAFDVFTTASHTLVQVLDATSKFSTVTAVKTAEEQTSVKESSPLSTDGHYVKFLMSSLKIKTLYRWKSNTTASASNTTCENEHKEQSIRPTSAKSLRTVAESEVIGLLTHIVEEAHTSVTQTLEALKLRCRQLAQKELRSRQRDNLKRLLLFAPCAGLLISYVVGLSTWILSNLDGYSELNQAQMRVLQKQLKSTLQTMENIRTYTASDKNKWSEAGELLLSEITNAHAKCEKHSYFHSS